MLSLRSRSGPRVAFSLVLACCARGASAQTSATWVGPADGSWNASTNWNPATVPGAGGAATFNSAAGGFLSDLNIALDTSVTLSQLTLNNPRGVKIAPVNPASHTIALSNATTFSASAGSYFPEPSNQFFTYFGQEIAPALTGSGSLNIQGGGGVYLSGASTFSGATAIRGGSYVTVARTASRSTDSALGTGSLTLDAGTLRVLYKKAN